MFDTLSEKFESIFKKLRGQGRLTEENIQEALREVRLVLLEADVNFKVVKDFVASVRESAIGQDVLKSLTPGQQVIKVVREELGRLMGEGEANHLDLGARPRGSDALRPARRWQNDNLRQTGTAPAQRETLTPPRAGRRLSPCCH